MFHIFFNLHFTIKATSAVGLNAWTFNITLLWQCSLSQNHSKLSFFCAVNSFSAFATIFALQTSSFVHFVALFYHLQTGQRIGFHVIQAAIRFMVLLSQDCSNWFFIALKIERSQSHITWFIIWPFDLTSGCPFVLVLKALFSGSIKMVFFATFPGHIFALCYVIVKL